MGEPRKHEHLTDEELDEFREIFNLVDLDKGGSISKSELKQLMSTLGLKPSQARGARAAAPVLLPRMVSALATRACRRSSTPWWTRLTLMATALST